MEDTVAEAALRKEEMTKEALDFNREIEALNRSIGSIKDMASLPGHLFIIDVGYHKIAIQEITSWAFGLSALSIPTAARWR